MKSQYFLLKRLFPTTVWEFDNAAFEGSKNSVFGVRLNGVTSGESSKRGHNKCFLGEPETSCSKAATGFVFQLNDGVEMSTNGKIFRSICRVVNDVDSVDLQGRNAFHGVGTKGALVVISEDESDFGGALSHPCFEL